MDVNVTSSLGFYGPGLDFAYNDICKKELDRASISDEKSLGILSALGKALREGSITFSNEEHPTTTLIKRMFAEAARIVKDEYHGLTVFYTVDDRAEISFNIKDEGLLDILFAAGVEKEKVKEIFNSGFFNNLPVRDASQRAEIIKDKAAFSKAFEAYKEGVNLFVWKSPLSPARIKKFFTFSDGTILCGEEV